MIETNIDMKKHLLFTLFAVLSLGVTSFALATSQKSTQEVSAAQTYTTPRSGSSGTIMFVGAGSSFDGADLAIYCFNNSSDNAWSDKVSYRPYNNMFRIMIPYQNGTGKTWSQFIICRYSSSMNPSTDGWSGVEAQTKDLSFSMFSYYQNTINVTGRDGNTLYVDEEKKSANYYYGIEADTHMYLDLSGFQGWEIDNAKFAIWFSEPANTNESRWSQSNSEGGYYNAFCWKVNGQGNDHLYECIVPNVSQDGKTIWGKVNAVRIDSAAVSPNWEQKFNQTQDLVFIPGNQNAGPREASGPRCGGVAGGNPLRMRPAHEAHHPPGQHHRRDAG